MTRTRRERRPERDEALGSLAGAAVAVAVWLAIRSYGSASHELMAQAAQIGATVAAGIALLCLGAVTWSGARWLTAVRQERMLRDPRRAALVPPRADHLARLRDNSGVGVAALGLLIGTFIIAVEVNRLMMGEDAAGDMLPYAALPLGAGLVGLTRWTRARRVEVMSRRSTPAGGTPPEPSPRRAARIPPLEVAHHAPTAHPTRGLRITAEHNVFGRQPWLLAYLRLFDNEARLEEFLGSAWRECGCVHLLGSAASVDRAELRAARAGQPLFIESRDRLLAELRARPPEPVSELIQESWMQRHMRFSQMQDRAIRQLTAQAAARGERPTRAEWQHLAQQLRAKARRRPSRRVYPVRSLMCRDSFWKSALDVLLDRMDAVVLDLSGYQWKNLGTGYELQRVVDRFPIRRCIVLADPHSDMEFLEAQIRHAWSQMADGSPNAGARPRSALVARTGQRAGAQASESAAADAPTVRTRQETLSLAAVLQRRLDSPHAT